MQYAIRYYSLTGNTKKLAEYLSGIIDIPAYTTDKLIDEPVDILFLGSAVYRAGVSKEIKKFIKTLNPNLVKKVVCFSTSAILESTYNQVSDLLVKQGISVAEEEFHCRGQFKFIYKGRPNERDLVNFDQFIKEFLKEYE